MPPRDRAKRRVTPNQARAHASIEAILDAAAILLHQRGFARTTTNHIAARAGVNVSLVYRYFAGKEAIVGALIERVANATYATVQKVLTDHARAPLPVAVRALLERLVDTPSAPALHRELVEHVDISKQRQLVRELGERIALLFADFLAQRPTELRTLADPQASLFVLQHAIEAAIHAASFYRPDELSVARVLDALTELVCRALLPIQDAAPRVGRPTRGQRAARTRR